MLKAIENIRKIARTDCLVDSIRPIQALIILDKNHPPDAIPKSVRLFRRYADNLGQHFQLSAPIETTHGKILPVVNSCVGAILIPTPSVVNKSQVLNPSLDEMIRSTSKDCQFEPLKHSFHSWNFPW